MIILASYMVIEFGLYKVKYVLYGFLKEIKKSMHKLEIRLKFDLWVRFECTFLNRSGLSWFI